MTVTEDQASLVHTLAEHYLDGKEMSPSLMIDAWQVLLAASREALGIGWSPAEVEAKYEPMIHRGDYSDDPDDCGGCHKLEDACERHTTERGVASMARAVATLASEPEVMGEVLRQADKFDAQATHDPTSPDHKVSRCLACRDVPVGTKIQINAACPACEHPRQWFEPAKREFSCQRCDRRSLDSREQNDQHSATLWCVHSPADSYIPVPSYRGAEMYARKITEIVHQDWPDLPPARVIPWPESAEEWRRLIDSAPWPARYCDAAEK